MKLHALQRFALLAALAAPGAGARSALASESSEAAETMPAMENIEAAPLAGFLRPGERIVLRLGWGLLSNAGQTTIETHPPDKPGGPVRVRVQTESRGMVRSLHPLQNDSTSYIDPVTGRPLRIEVSGRDGKREVRTTTVFDYEKGTITHVDEIRPHRNGTAKLPDEPAYDIMVAMLRLRHHPIAPGKSRVVMVANEDDILEIELKALREDSIRTRAGRFDAVEIEPQQRGELKGFFRKGGAMHFWISKGENPQLVRLDFKVKMGTITGVLTAVETIGSASDEDPRP